MLSQNHPKPRGLHRLLELVQQCLILEDVVLSGRDVAAALLSKPESKQPCLQRHWNLACSKAHDDSGAHAGAPFETRLLQRNVGPAALEQGHVANASHCLGDRR